MISPYLQPVGPEPNPPVPPVRSCARRVSISWYSGRWKNTTFLEEKHGKVVDISRLGGTNVLHAAAGPQPAGRGAPQIRALWPAVRRDTSVVRSVNGIGGPPPTSHGWSSPVGGRAGALETKGCARVTLPGVASAAAGRRMIASAVFTACCGRLCLVERRPSLSVCSGGAGYAGTVRNRLTPIPSTRKSLKLRASSWGIAQSFAAACTLLRGLGAPGRRGRPAASPASSTPSARSRSGAPR